MMIADAVSLRMSCDRARIGAVIVSPDHHILATGYGGAPAGMPSCDEVGHDLVEINGRPSCVRTVHAEKNAIIYAARHGVRIDGATLYTTASTCMDCAMACIQAGIKKIVYASEYTSARSGGKNVGEILINAGVALQHSPLAKRIAWPPQ
jgi:dCMP deaminase